MKKICFVTTIYATYKSFLKQLSYYLYESGEYSISLICNNEEDVLKDLPSFVNYYPVSMKRGVSLSAFNSISQIKKILKQEQFDIVQYSTPNASFYTSVAAKKVKVPVRLYCQWGIRYMGFSGWKRAIFKFLEKKTCANSTCIEVESHNIRQFSLSENLYSADKSSVIWNGSASGVDFNKFDISKKDIWRKTIRERYDIRKDDVVFAFAGRLTADKGVNELLEAFLCIESKFLNAKLFILGGIDNYETLNDELFKKAKQSDNIIFTGNIPNIEEYYAASDVFVAPSYREGFGLVVIEAESMGLPALVSNVPGQVDAIEEKVTGLTFNVKDTVSLQKTMEKLLTDFDLRIKLGDAAHDYVKENYEQNKLFSYLKQHRDALIKGEK